MHDSFDDFYRGVFDPLVGALWVYCGDRVLAEEFAQEALARVARDWNKVANMDAPRGWTHRVAFNLATSHFRRRQIERRALGRHAAQTVDAVEPAPVAEHLRVRHAVSALSTRQRHAVALFYFADLPVAEVADVMKVPVNTVKSWLSRARKALERELVDEERSDVEGSDVH